VKGQQKAFETSEWYDYLTGFVVAAILSTIASFLVTFIGGIGFFGWFLIAAGAPTAGVAIAEGVRMVTGRRRSRALFATVAAAVVVGALPVILFQLVFAQNLFSILFQIIYLVIAVPVAYSRLSGIQLFR
jgi:hypothetical protein